MATTEPPATLPCPECKEPMTLDLLAPPFAASEGQWERLPPLRHYRCPKGHTSRECPICHRYETRVWGIAAADHQAQIQCYACGNMSTIQWP